MYNPFQNSNDEYFPSSTDYYIENNEIENQINWADYGLAGAGLDQVVNYTNNNNGELNNNGRRNNVDQDNNDDDEQKKKKKKKSAHKEIERQRRQEMSGLYSALRSELPAEYIKGKRSASDHVAEAVNYIKDLEKSVKELSIRRDELRASPEWAANPTYHHVGGSSRPGSVMINPRVGGLGIQIDVPYQHHQTFSLSSALHVLYEEGLSVSSCTSTNVNDRIIHNIICEVMDMTSINFSWLQQRLINLVS